MLALVGALTHAVPAAESLPAGRAEIHDTAWDLVSKGTPAEITAYFEHIKAAGFDGTWLSLMPLDGWGFDSTEQATGTFAGTIDDDGSLHLTPEHRDQVKFVLDEARRTGVQVTIAPMWGVGYVHGHWQGGACTKLGKGPLNADTAYGWGHEIGSEFAHHSAIDRWLLGGDNFCNTEDKDIWSEMARGLRDTGAQQPMGYHTPAGTTQHSRFDAEPWHQFYAVQTSHCTRAARAEVELTKVRELAGAKKVYAAELRYEAIAPDWPGCIHTPRTPVLESHIAADVTAAIRAGVDGVVYGHNERWQWGNNILGATGDPVGSFGAPGEKAAIALVRGGSVKPTTTTTSTTTTSTSTTVLPTSTTEAPTSTTPPASTTTTSSTTTSTPNTSTSSTSTTSTSTTSTSTTLVPGKPVTCKGEVATIVGTAGDNVLVGTNGPDVIVSLGGNDVIDGRGGDDLICAGRGSDHVLGGKGDDRIFGGSGRDKIHGNAGNDVLHGGASVDQLRGGGGDDELDGGRGKDKLVGGGGEDRCIDSRATQRKGCELAE